MLDGKGRQESLKPSKRRPSALLGIAIKMYRPDK